jgi:hypothetical protein
LLTCALFVSYGDARSLRQRASDVANHGASAAVAACAAVELTSSVATEFSNSEPVAFTWTIGAALRTGSGKLDSEQQPASRAACAGASELKLRGVPTDGIVAFGNRHGERRFTCTCSCQRAAEQSNSGYASLRGR